MRLDRMRDEFDWRENHGVNPMRVYPGCCERCGMPRQANGDPNDKGCTRCGYDPYHEDWEDEQNEPEPYDLIEIGHRAITTEPTPRRAK
jgi:hypothetical protein